jgi:hypothetical protein
MQSPHIGMLFADRFMLMPQIVDKNRYARPIFFENSPKRLTLATLIAIDWRINTNGPQLLCARSCAVVKQVGQDNNIGMFTQAVEAVYRAMYRLLPVHFGIEKAIEQIPNPPAFNDRAVMFVAQRLSPIAMDKVEVDVMRLIEPIAKGHNHMKQHFVAI